MATLRLIKNIDQNMNHSLLKMLSAFIFGGQEIRHYSPNRSYYKGDIIAYMDHGIKILQLHETSATGEFNIADWTEISVSDIITGKQPASQIVFINEIEPTEPSCQIWYHQLDTRTALDPSEHQTIILDGDEVAIQDDEPSEDTKLWVDTND